MPRLLRNFPLKRLLCSILAAASATSGIVVGCSGDDLAVSPSQLKTTAASPPVSEPRSLLAESSAARARVDSLVAAFPKALAHTTSAMMFEQDKLGRLHRQTSRKSAKGRADIELPQRAHLPARIVDEASGLGLSFTLEGAREVSAASARGLVFYPAAGPGNTDVIHHVYDGGTEDFIFLDKRSEIQKLRYRIDLDAGSALRLVDRTLEILDAHGVPRLRVAPPVVYDSKGMRRAAAIDVEGCAVDRDPRAPWDRSVTSPSSNSCTVVIDFHDDSFHYPILVDPNWQSTAGSMIRPRYRASIVEIPQPSPQPPAPPKAGIVLITGGKDNAGAAVSSAELYRPLDRIFAATGSMNTARAAHTSTVASTVGGPRVIITGGANDPDVTNPANAGLLRSTEVYDPVSGTFVPAPDMGFFRYEHTATALADGRVLVAGGYATTALGVAPQASRSAELLTTDFATGQVSIAPGPDMAFAHAAHTSVLLQTGDVLIAGGFNTAGFSQQKSEVFCANAATHPCSAMNMNTFVATIDLPGPGRAFHTVTRLLDGKVLFTGGSSAATGAVSYANSAVLFTPGASVNMAPTAQIVSMTERRAFHTATLLTTGEVLLAGGIGGPGVIPPVDLASSEKYAPSTNSFTNLSPMTTTRKGHVALLVNAGDSAFGGKTALVAGGKNAAGTPVASAELLVRDLGEACTQDDECLSGHCTGADGSAGICCNVECGELCVSCTQMGKEIDQAFMADGVCGYAKAGTELGWNCVPDQATSIPVEFFLICDGKGTTKPKTGTTCGPNGCNPVTNRCSDQCPCSDAGFCTDAAPEDPDAAVPTEDYCLPRKNNSEKCTYGLQCNSGNCVDGVCCNSACTEQCQACDIPGFVGTCATTGSNGINEPPHGDRTPCNGVGTACGGVCDGTIFTKCAYPNDPEKPVFSSCVCEGNACTAISEQTNYFCDGNGAITVPAPIDCKGFECDPSGGPDTSPLPGTGPKGVCRTTCENEADCLEDFFCEANATGVKVCVSLPAEGRCDGAHTVRKPAAADQDCTPYTCVGSSCRTTCKSVDECVAPTVCSLEGSCVLPPPPPPPPLSCSMSTSRGSSGDAAWLCTMLGLVIARARRRTLGKWGEIDKESS